MQGSQSEIPSKKLIFIKNLLQQTHFLIQVLLVNQTEFIFTGVNRGTQLSALENVNRRSFTFSQQGPNHSE